MLVMTKMTIYLSLSLQNSKDFSYSSDPVITSHQHDCGHSTHPADAAPETWALLRASTNPMSAPPLPDFPKIKLRRLVLKNNPTSRGQGIPKASKGGRRVMAQCRRLLLHRWGRDMLHPALSTSTGSWLRWKLPVFQLPQDGNFLLRVSTSAFIGFFMRSWFMRGGL